MTVAISILGFFILSFVVYYIIPTVLYLRFKAPPFSVKENEKTVLLSFDDGPDPRYTPELLDILEENKVCAVFFVVAEKAERNPEIIEQIRGRGHLLGFHSLEHKDAWRMSPGYQRRELESGIEVMKSLGCEPRFYRAPWGHLNLTSLVLARKHGLRILLWTVMAQDWESESSARRVSERVKRRVRNGSVICLHDSGCGKGAAEGAPAHTVEAVSQFLPELLSDGFKFVLPEPNGRATRFGD